MLVTTITLIPQSYSILFHIETVVTSHNNYHLPVYPPFNIISWTTSGWNHWEQCIYTCYERTSYYRYFIFSKFLYSSILLQVLVSHFLLFVRWEIENNLFYRHFIALKYRYSFQLYLWISIKIFMPALSYLEILEKNWWIYF